MLVVCLLILGGVVVRDFGSQCWAQLMVFIVGARLHQDVAKSII